jgi:hypothetical protein
MTTNQRNESNAISIMVAVICLIAIAAIFVASGNQNADDTLCAAKHQKETDSTHQFGSEIVGKEIYCVVYLKSCNLDGTGCYTIEKKRLEKI